MQVAADSGVVRHGFDPGALETLSGADAGAHEQQRGFDGSRAHDGHACFDGRGAAFDFGDHAGHARTRQGQSMHSRFADHSQIGARARGVEIGVGCGDAASGMDGE